MTARLAPLEAPYDPETEHALRRWMPPGTEALDPLALFRTLGRHLELSEAMRPLGAFLLSRRRSGLDPADRELVIARVCARRRCEYEWGVHVAAFAEAAGLSAEQVHDTAQHEVDPGLWSARQRALLALADELVDTAHVTDRTWAEVGEHVDEQQRLVLLVLVGWYGLISTVANGAQVQPEPWAPSLPPT